MTCAVWNLILLVQLNYCHYLEEPHPVIIKPDVSQLGESGQIRNICELPARGITTVSQSLS